MKGKSPSSIDIFINKYICIRIKLFNLFVNLMVKSKLPPEIARIAQI